MHIKSTFANCKKPSRVASCVALAALAACAVTFWYGPTVVADAGGPVLSFDIAQDGNTFVFQGPETPDGFPAAGATFIVQGFVYPEGTLQGGAVSGTNADGTPAFPELVMGTWSCRGWFTQDCDPGITGIVLVGTQVWDLDSGEPGSRTIVTDGVDLSINDVDLGVPFIRAITGGTGEFNRARGEQTTINFGFNDSFGIDSTHELDRRGSGGG